jgi:hypothetical protein
VLHQTEELIFDVPEGVEAPVDVLLWILEDLLQVFRPLGEDAKHRGVAGRELFAGYFLLAEEFNRGRDLLTQSVLLVVGLHASDALFSLLPKITRFILLRLA